MKVKARVKAREYLPEWAKCCPESESDLYSLGDFVVDLERTWDVRGIACCRHCEQNYPGDNLPTVQIVSSGKYIPFQIIDLDEGPMETQ